MSAFEVFLFVVGVYVLIIAWMVSAKNRKDKP